MSDQQRAGQVTTLMIGGVRITTNACMPFGLVMAAREPIPVDEVDLTALVYDPERQIMLVRDGETDMVMPWCRHSTGKTRTDSNTDGKGGRETDEDYTED
jgi:putative ATP-grasp target RiPP